MAMEERLVVSSGPHIRKKETTADVMYNVALALLPTSLAGIYYFGIHGLWLIISCVVAALITEAVAQKMRGVKIDVSNGSALVTGLLTALILPPGLPLWMAVLGTVIGIGLGKHVFGGLGDNFFNPALVGRAFLMASFPVAMTTWKMVDATSSATPLASEHSPPLAEMFFGSIGGSLGETSAALIILGGLYLLYKGYIDWRIPTGYLGTVAVLTTVFGNRGPGFHLLAGGVMIGAFFMATDMVTSPVTKLGRWIFAVGCGFLTVLIRVAGGYPEGVMYSILLMNMCVPLIDRYTQPRIYGEVTKDE